MTSAATHTTRPLTKNVLEQLRDARGELSLTARTDDLAETFPEAGMEILRRAGCLKSVLPSAYGGTGACWARDPAAADQDFLRSFHGDSSRGCNFSAHVRRTTCWLKRIQRAMAY
ncbi:hypothetical protein HDE78_003035 [Rhodanobacter sp. K2T2]|uniref:hypothetical protein n=1 Tax=Rhodanobacter sp. K2T2 TaxID=2723085 RepID=UPI0015CEE212|nr:hypothetical protein [Rhodanobacter sp. K2T2]NYE30067.1 hypothetical protein [Rhodanobacter sp. K2T2]